MIDRAMDSTTTIAVAAERPPSTAASRDRSVFGPDRQGHHADVAVHRLREHHQPGDRHGYDEKIDRQQIEREGEGGGADIALVVVFDHGDMELAGQEQHGAAGEQGQRGPDRKIRRRRQDRANARDARRTPEQVAQPVEHAPDDKGADREKGEKLDRRLGGDGQHQAVLVLAGVDASGAEGHGETREQQGDDQRQMIRRLDRSGRFGQRNEAEAGHHRRRDGLELQGDIGHDAQHGNQRHGGGHRLGLAIAGGEEIGDGRGVLRMGDARDSRHQRPAKAEHQHRANIDRQEIQAVGGSQPHRAEESPGGAIDAQAQRINDLAGGAPQQARALAVAIGGQSQ